MPPKLSKSDKVKSAEPDEEELSIMNAKRFAEIGKRGELDMQMGFAPFLLGSRLGWMLNMQSVYHHSEAC